MTKNYDESVEMNHNRNWSYIPVHPYKTLIVGGSGSSKINVLLNLIKHQRPDINKTYLYVKDPLESNYRLFMNGREKVEIENFPNPKAFLDSSRKVDNPYENLEDYSSTKKESVNNVW